MKKGIVGIFMAVCVGGAALGDSATNVLGQTWSYAVVGGKATVMGVSPGTGDVEVPRTLGKALVTRIGDGAFRGCWGLVSLTIPDSVTAIGRQAFAGCDRLTNFVVNAKNTKFIVKSGMLCAKDGKTLVQGVNGSVTVPSGVKAIGESAFYGLGGLASVALPASVTSIGDQAFDFCGGLKSVSVDADNAMFRARDGMLYSKDGKRLIRGVGGIVEIPPDVKDIGDGAFSGCEGLAAVLIPPSVTSIGDRAFSGCGALPSVTIPASVEFIGVGAFENCGGIWAFSVAEDNPNYCSANGLLCTKGGTRLIRGVNGGVLVPKSVTRIEASAFANCRQLVSVSMPTTVMSVGKGAFEDTSLYDGQPEGVVVIGCALCGVKGNCPSLVSIPTNVTVIADSAFEDCGGLRSVKMPPNVTHVGEGAFAGCGDLKTVYVDGEDEVARVRGLYAWADNVSFKVVQSYACSLGVCVNIDTGFSCYEVQGLPPGMRFTKSTGFITGAGTSVGDYLVTFSVSGVLTEMMTINVKEEVVTLDEKAIAAATLGVGLQGSVKISALASSTGIKSISVSGQPEGMVFDPKTSSLVGAPTKSGEFKMTVTVTTDGGTVKSFEMTLSVAAPALSAVGTFNGFVVRTGGDNPVACGTIVFTSTDAGKLTAKVTTPAGTYSFSRSGWDAVSNGVYAVRLSNKTSTLDLSLDAEAERDAHQLVGTFVASGDTFDVSAQRNLFGTPFFLTATGDRTSGWTFVQEQDAECPALSLTVSADGSASLSGTLDGIRIRASGTVDVSGREDGVLLVEFVQIVSVDSDGKNVKRPLYFRLNLWVDRKGCAGTVEGAAMFGERKDDPVVTAETVIRAEDVVRSTEPISVPDLVVGLYASVEIKVDESAVGVKTISVSGQPKGMKFDKNSSCLVGTPSKSGEFRMKVKVKTVDGLQTSYEMPMTVAAPPPVAVGTFNGFVGRTDADGFVGCGTISLKADETGKLAVKIVTAAGSLSLKSPGWEMLVDGIYTAHWTTAKGERLELALDTNAAWDACRLVGTLVVGENAYEVSARHEAFSKTWYFSATGDEVSGWTLGYAENAKSAALTLKVKASGATTIAGKLGSVRVSASGAVDIGGLKEGALLADFVQMVSVKVGRQKIKKPLCIRTNLWFNRQPGHEAGVGTASFVPAAISDDKAK